LAASLPQCRDLHAQRTGKLISCQMILADDRWLKGGTVSRILDRVDWPKTRGKTLTGRDRLAKEDAPVSVINRRLSKT